MNCILAALLLHCCLVASPFSQHRLDVPRLGNSVAEVVPGTVAELVTWPSEDAIRGEPLPCDCKEASTARHLATEWLTMTLDEKWRPPGDVQPLCTKDEFQNADTVRLEWIAEDHRVRLSQTAVVLVLTVRPLAGGGTGDGLASRTACAREICSAAFNDRAFMYVTNPNGFPRRMTIEGMKSKLCSYAFNPAHIRELSGDGAVIGAPTPLTEEQIAAPDDNAPYMGPPEGIAADQAVLTAYAWSYWFRHVHWINDGESITFYFIKIAGPGAWRPAWGGPIDETWFDIPRDRRGNPAKSTVAS